MTFEEHRNRLGHILGSASALALAVAMNTAAVNAQDQDTAQADDEEELEEVIVTGFRSSLQQSLVAKRNASQVIDAISAEELGQFPDQNIAEAASRISGVQIFRQNGEGEKISIRGLDPDFTRVEIDGRSTMLTSDENTAERSTTLTGFASDLYSQVEVVKSTSASDIEGGLGGTVRLKTPSPLEIGDLKYGASLNFRKFETRDSWEYDASAFFSNVLIEDKLGVMLSVQIEDSDQAIDKIQNNASWRQLSELDPDSDDPALASALANDQARYAQRFRQEGRFGDQDNFNINGKIQLKVSEQLELGLNVLVARESFDRHLARITTEFHRGDLLSLTDFDADEYGGSLGYTDSIIVDSDTNTVLAMASDRGRIEARDFRRVGDIYNHGGNFTIDFDPSDEMHIDLDITYSKGVEDWDQWRTIGRYDRVNVAYDLTQDPKFPVVILPQDASDGSNYQKRDLDFDRREIGIEEWSARFDLEYQLDGDVFSSFKVGARYSDTLAYEQDRASLNASSTSDWTYGDADPYFSEDQGFFDGVGPDNLLRMWPAVDAKTVYELFDSGANIDDNIEDSYEITEKTYAGYLQANYETDALGWFARGNFGIRAVRTEFSGFGLSSLIDVDGEQSETASPVPIENNRTDWLPSFNFVLSETEDSNLLIRGAVAKGMTRPTFRQLMPSVELDLEDSTGEQGNPNLRPFLAWQYDLGLEYYFGEGNESALTFAVFAKDVKEFIFTREFTDGNGDPESTRTGIFDGTAYVVDEFETSVNGGSASIKGFEVGFQTPFTFLPEPFDGFGFFGNYTYTDSKWTTETGLEQPFPGSSKHTYNAVVYYEKGGFSSRLAYNYRDDYIVVPTVDGINSEFFEGQGRLDASVRYRFENGIRLSADIQNLTNARGYRYYDVTDRLEDIEGEGRIFSLGIAYSF